VATRFDAHEFGDGFFSTLHEGGHALYDQGLDPAHHGTPMGEPASLGVHESQSRLWENIVGRGLPAWRHWFPLARRFFPEALRDVSLEEFLFAANRVETSLIRVDADEVTYNLHVFVRYDLERALISGDLAVADLPGAWDEAYRRHLGIVPANDAEGCLQDIHWSAGLIGYFPTYTLGNLFAAQLYNAAVSELGDLDAAFALGDFAGMLGWLRDRVHRQGQRHRSPALIEAATGSPPGPGPLVQALGEKYGRLYGI
jgi:carboxypeptidase Taq